MSKAPFKCKAVIHMEFEFTTDADGLGDAQWDALYHLKKHVMEDECDRGIDFHKFECIPCEHS